MMMMMMMMISIYIYDTCKGDKGDQQFPSHMKVKGLRENSNSTWDTTSRTSSPLAHGLVIKPFL